MKKLTAFLLISLFLFGAEPIKLHPDNPHYFEYKGHPFLLITSAEHYGAVLNLDFNYAKYLQTMHDAGMNYTRIFTGSYVERPGSFGIGNNTLAPDVGRFLAPWQRVNQPGLYQGEGKVDLGKFNPDYFKRLRDFISKAENLGIIVEVTFFSSIYADENWERNPFNPANNINISHSLDRKKSNTLDNGDLLKYQKEMVAKIVRELKDYTNVIYEIQNEPWSDDPQKVLRTHRTLDPQCDNAWFKWSDIASDASLGWQRELAQLITNIEADFEHQHLIAQNYCNFKYAIKSVDENIDVMNFHYAWPEAVRMNYAWDRPISFDESGFAGQSDTMYLRQAWQFILAGGAVFNNLDYSFSVGNEDGRGEIDAPGGGSPGLRKQLKYLHDFMTSLDFVSMKPNVEVVYHAPGLEWHGLSEPGKQYAMIFHGTSAGWIKLKLPWGKYEYEFVCPFTSEVLEKGTVKGSLTEFVKMELPEFKKMVTLKIVN